MGLQGRHKTRVVFSSFRSAHPPLRPRRPPFLIHLPQSSVPGKIPLYSPARPPLPRASTLSTRVASLPRGPTGVPA